MQLLLPLILLSCILQCYAQGKDDPSDSKLSQSFAWTEKQLKTNQIKKRTQRNWLSALNLTPLEFL